MSPASPKAKIEYAIICDDVRREENGKMMIIGAYASDIGLPSYPARLRLCMVLGIRFNIVGKVPISVRVLQDGKKVLEMAGDIDAAAPGSFGIIGLSNINVNIVEDTQLDFQARADQSRYRSVCKLPVRVNPS